MQILPVTPLRAQGKSFQFLCESLRSALRFFPPSYCFCVASKIKIRNYKWIKFVFMWMCACVWKYKWNIYHFSLHLFFKKSNEMKKQKEETYQSIHSGRPGKPDSRPGWRTGPPPWASARSERLAPPSAALSGSGRWTRWPPRAQTQTRTAPVRHTWGCHLVASNEVGQGF